MPHCAVIVEKTRKVTFQSNVNYTFHALIGNTHLSEFTSHNQHNRSQCGQNCKSLFIALTQNAFNDQVFQKCSNSNLTTTKSLYLQFILHMLTHYYKTIRLKPNKTNNYYKLDRNSLQSATSRSKKTKTNCDTESLFSFLDDLYESML